MLPNMEENYLELCVAILCVFSRLENALCMQTVKIWRVNEGETKS